jgi:hypothetical protein
MSRRRIIESDLGNGRSTIVPYGFSVDFSEEAERLREIFERLPEYREFQKRRASRSIKRPKP